MLLPPRIPVHLLRGCRRPESLGGAGISLRCGSTTTAAPPAADTRHKVLVVGGGRMGQIRASAFYGSRKSQLAGGWVGMM